MVKRKILLLGFFFTMLFVMTAPGQAVVFDTTEDFSVSKVAFDDMSITIHCYDLESGNQYSIITSPDGGTTNTTQVTWTADSSGENTFYFSVSTPSDKTLEVYMKDVTDSQSEMRVVYFPDDDDIVNQDSLTNYIILVALIVIPVLLIKGVMKGFR